MLISLAWKNKIFPIKIVNKYTYIYTFDNNLSVLPSTNDIYSIFTVYFELIWDIVDYPQPFLLLLSP